MLQSSGQSITSKESFEREQPIKLVLSIYTQSLSKKQIAQKQGITSQVQTQCGVCNRIQALWCFYTKLKFKKNILIRIGIYDHQGNVWQFDKRFRIINDISLLPMQL